MWQPPRGGVEKWGTELWTVMPKTAWREITSMRAPLQSAGV
jgi:hypothetical protein